MSLCRTCEYALYDGMCLAHGKFTLLDAPACDDYKMHLDVEVSKLKADNAKLRELVTDYFNAPCVECNPWDEGWQGCKHCDSGNCNLAVRALKLGIEVDE